MPSLPHITHFGLPGIDRVPFGVHACHFYKTKDQLIAALVPYFVAGLNNKERCLWITAPPLPARAAIEALQAAWDGVDDALQADALRILDFDQWYTKSSGLKGLEVIQLWLDEEARALAEGYNGLRISGNTSFLKPGDWSTFMEYEQALNSSFNGRRIVTLCSYALALCNDQQTSEVIHAHQCALHGPDSDGHWAASSVMQN